MSVSVTDVFIGGSQTIRYKKCRLLKISYYIKLGPKFDFETGP